MRYSIFKSVKVNERKIKMKKYALLFCFLLLASCAHVSDNSTETASHTSVDGWWAGKYKNASLLFKFNSDGDILTGTVDGMPGMPVLHLSDGKIKGNWISFRTETDYGRNKLKTSYKGDLKKDVITFSYTTTVTGPQGNSGRTSRRALMVVNRIGSGNETRAEIDNILKRNFMM